MYFSRRSPTRTSFEDGVELLDGQQFVAHAAGVGLDLGVLPGRAGRRGAYVLGALGLRLAEVVALRVGSVDFLRRTLTVEDTLNEVGGRFIAGGGKTKAAARTIGGSVAEP